YTTFTRSAGTSRALITKSAVLFETAIAMSVAGARIRSAIFWNHGVSVRLACSWRIVGRPRIHPAVRPNVVAPYPCSWRMAVSWRSITFRSAVSVAGSNFDLWRYVMSIPIDSSVSSDRSFFRRLTSDTLYRAGSNRGIIQLKSRLTPCIRDPSHPRGTQTCRTYVRTTVSLDPSFVARG